MFHKDYDIAREKAQDLANSTGQLLRLRKVKGLENGYAYGFVPAPSKQFGRDLDGELIQPEELKFSPPGTDK